MKGILGRKIGMTQVFDQDGKLTPVTVVEVTPNVVTQIKTKENDGYEAILLCPRSADREQPAHGSAVFGSRQARLTIPLYIAYQFVVDIVACECDVLRGHGVQYVIFIHTAQHPVAYICGRGLYCMERSLGKMQRHGPVIGDNIYHIGEPCMDSRLGRPHMSRTERDICGDIGKHRSHELSSLLIRTVIGYLPETFTVERLPDGFVEEWYLLGKP